MMQSLTEYMKKELIFFIKQEYDKGHSLKKIREALLEGGHHKDLVREAISALRKNDFNVVKALDEPIKKHLDQDLYYDIMNSLIKYVEFQLKKGFTPKKIKKILKEYGHSEDIIKQAIDAAQKTSSQMPWLIQALEYGFLVLFALFLVFISGSTQDSMDIILFAFSPVIFTIVAVYVGMRSKVQYSLLWLAPVALTLIFSILVTLSPSLAYGMETMKIAVLNVVLGIIFVYIKISRTFNSGEALETLEKEVQTKNDKGKKS